MFPFINERNGVFPAVCSLDCPDQCGLLLHKENGRIIKVEGDPNHPVTQGNICNKVRNMTNRIYDEKRLRFPMKRIGKKGEGKFERISWNEAIKTITDKWKELLKTAGPESILPYHFYGNMGNLNAAGMGGRFFHRLGASILDETICQSAGTTGYKYTMGGNLGTDPEDTIHAKLIILWGINAVSTNMHQIAFAQKARKNGAKIIVIDAHKNQTGKFADWFIPILPGSDGALALGIMHILFAENMVSNVFLEEYTVGHEKLREHVIQYDPLTISKITGVSIDDLYKLARMYGEISPSFIRIGNGLQHHDNGGMNTRTIACLPALTGQWLLKGGGANKANSGFLSHNDDKLQRPDLLKNPNTRIINMNQLGKALLEMTPPIKSMFVYNSNPALCAPEGNKVRAGLEREDLFLIVHDLFLTETAEYADIILPATSSYENRDFYSSYWHHYIQIQQPVIAPFEESKSNVDVFRLLAKGMDFQESLFNDSEAEMIAEALNNPSNPYLNEITYEKLVEKQFVKANIRPLFPGKLPTLSGKIELYSKKMLDNGYHPLPTYIPLKEDGDFPFLFIPGPNHNFLNSTFSKTNKHISLEKEPRLFINEDDASSLKIENGEKVRIWNERGECELTVSIGDSVLPGVVVSQGLWAKMDGTKRMVNSLTPDRLSDMGGGATFFSGRVQIEKI